jgi:hypothetical protein
MTLTIDEINHASLQVPALTAATLYAAIQQVEKHYHKAPLLKVTTQKGCYVNCSMPLLSWDTGGTLQHKKSKLYTNHDNKKHLVSI